MLAQVLGLEYSYGGLESGDISAAAIDKYVWVLEAIGLVDVFLRIRALERQ